MLIKKKLRLIKSICLNNCIIYQKEGTVGELVGSAATWNLLIG